MLEFIYVIDGSTVASVDVDPQDCDGLRALHDSEAGAGDDGEYADLFTLDALEARELGVDLDPVADEPVLG